MDGQRHRPREDRDTQSEGVGTARLHGRAGGGEPPLDQHGGEKVLDRRRRGSRRGPGRDRRQGRADRRRQQQAGERVPVQAGQRRHVVHRYRAPEGTGHGRGLGQGAEGGYDGRGDQERRGRPREPPLHRPRHAAQRAGPQGGRAVPESTRRHRRGRGRRRQRRFRAARGATDLHPQRQQDPGPSRGHQTAVRDLLQQALPGEVGGGPRRSRCRPAGHLLFRQMVERRHRGVQGHPDLAAQPAGGRHVPADRRKCPADPCDQGEEWEDRPRRRIRLGLTAPTRNSVKRVPTLRRTNRAPPGTPSPRPTPHDTAVRGIGSNGQTRAANEVAGQSAEILDQWASEVRPAMRHADGPALWPAGYPLDDENPRSGP
ncbi:hypothetical protein FAGKG844_10049 [Frankia sp. AgKG'84/4]